ALRVGSLVVLDSNLVAYIFSADTSAWQAVPLGGGPGMATPKDLASYDGNIYLLASKPGQISKYVAGKYGGTPDDWIHDPASADQTKDAVAMAIDGSIYALMPAGRIVVVQGGKAARTRPLKTGGERPASAQLLTSRDTQAP